MLKEQYKSVAEKAVENWYKQINNYDFGSHSERNQRGQKISDFTQVVWKKSVKLGVGIAKANDGKLAHGADGLNFYYIFKLYF